MVLRGQVSVKYRVHHSAARNFNTESVNAEINAHTNKQRKFMYITI